MAFLREHQAITPQEIKDLLGISRKYAIPLLEWLDTQRLTVRVGDKRVLRDGAPAGLTDRAPPGPRLSGAALD